MDRDELAKAAMQSLVIVRQKATATSISRSAYDIADAMLEEGVKRRSQPKRIPSAGDPSHRYRPSAKFPPETEVPSEHYEETIQR